MGWQDDPIIAGRPKWESDPIVSPVASLSADTIAAPMIDIRVGVPVPVIIPPSANPYSAGRYANNRIYTIGDEATYRVSDLLSGVEQRTYTRRVTRVNLDEDRVEFNNGRIITDSMGNSIKTGTTEFAAPRQWNPAEFQVGKKWIAAFQGTERGVTWNTVHNMQIVKRETITVPAGTFDTFRIEGEGANITLGIRGEMTRWLVPGLNCVVRDEQIRLNRNGTYSAAYKQELISVRQHIIDTKM